MDYVNQYELMYIVAPNLGEDETRQVVDKVTEFFKKHGANVRSVNEWGVRKMAYRVAGHQEGYYVLVEVQIPQRETLKELSFLIKTEARIIRHLLVRLPKAKFLEDERKKEVAERRRREEEERRKAEAEAKAKAEAEAKAAEAKAAEAAAAEAQAAAAAAETAVEPAASADVPAAAEAETLAVVVPAVEIAEQLADQPQESAPASEDAPVDETPKTEPVAAESAVGDEESPKSQEAPS